MSNFCNWEKHSYFRKYVLSTILKSTQHAKDCLKSTFFNTLRIEIIMHMKGKLAKAYSFNYDQTTISWEIHCMTAAAEHTRLGGDQCVHPDR